MSYFQSGDEAIIAPLSLFYPELLILTGAKQITTQGANIGDPTDPHDADYLRETGVSTYSIYLSFNLLQIKCLISEFIILIKFYFSILKPLQL